MDFGDDSVDSLAVANSDEELPEGLDDSEDESDHNNANIDESDNYHSESSDVSFVDRETREEAAVNDEVLVLSKDKTIQYSNVPLPPARPPVCSLHHGKFYFIKVFIQKPNKY